MAGFGVEWRYSKSNDLLTRPPTKDQTMIADLTDILFDNKIATLIVAAVGSYIVANILGFILA